MLTKGDPNPQITPATDLVATPMDEDGQPIPGATVKLECGEPPRSNIGNEQDDGTYVFNINFDPFNSMFAGLKMTEQYPSSHLTASLS